MNLSSDDNLPALGNYNYLLALPYSRMTLFTKQLPKVLANKNIIVAAAHPGFVNSQFCRDIVNNPVFNFLSNFAMYFISTLFTRSGTEGAKIILFAATDDSIKSEEYYDSCAVGVV
ncbi:hypothetical protein CONCODRAFT_8808 [Conidiobolus coronatus NRRL 28638]|uniref:NAD(P)-binding protein n=1 Tax=Conidiobolus coronatus (strain ATCC 28846 / CBS 209.66 / NRRL 28638) TaxID=796925 RepID=A0A137P1T5_CONC2|nr:hypothetical protein CONCODRAFT_8808 [Conidiobolus coronatus NRRL 28638]|eukprot:KXN68844.1 hypothetical protein CONCODRAFT_8808 [Conidiobolus coronatus NRRL 28638]